MPFLGRADLNVQRGAKPRLREEAMQARYEAGSSLSQIAAVAKIQPARVATILLRRGVRLRRHGATRACQATNWCVSGDADAHAAKETPSAPGDGGERRRSGAAAPGL